MEIYTIPNFQKSKKEIFWIRESWLYHFGAVLNGLFSVESPVLSGDALTHDSGVFVNEDRSRRRRIRREGARLGQRTEWLAWRKNLLAAAWTTANFRGQRSEKPCDLPRHDCLSSLIVDQPQETPIRINLCGTLKLCEDENGNGEKENSASFVWRISRSKPDKKEASSFKGYTFLNFSPNPIFLDYGLFWVFNAFY